MVPGWIVIVSFTMAMIGATVENVSTMPNRRRMMFWPQEQAGYFATVLVKE